MNTTLEKPPGLIRGVALVIVNPAGEILIGQEFEPKPWLGKFFGNFSIPKETCEPGESWEDTVRRITEPNEELEGFAFELPVTWIGRYQIVPDVWVRLCATKTNSFALPTVQVTAGVGNHQWMLPTEARKLWLRQGAAEMISDYAAGYRHTHRQKCAEVKPYAAAA